MDAHTHRTLGPSRPTARLDEGTARFDEGEGHEWREAHSRGVPCAAVSLAVSLTVCALMAADPAIAWAGAPTFLRPESTTAREIDSLAIMLLVICALVLVVVEGILVVSITASESDAKRMLGRYTGTPP